MISAVADSFFAQQGDDVLYLAQNGFVADSIVDGPGLRCTVFVQGCPHGCPGCHNPATHPFCTARPAAVEEVYRRIKKSPLCRGVTFSGGEPFCQAAPLANLAGRLLAAGYELAAYTGYIWEQLRQGSPAQRLLLSRLHILVDGPYLERERNLALRFRGSANQRILQVPASLAEGEPVWETAPRWVGGAE